MSWLISNAFSLTLPFFIGTIRGLFDLLNMSKNKKIDFFLAGFSKCGTTSIAYICDQHPDICFARPKEPNLFLKDHYQEDFFKEVFDHKQSDEYKLVGEGSQRYSMRDRFPNVAQYIYQHNPDAKFIFVARHPLERSISHYKMIDRDVDLDISINQIFDKSWLVENVVNTSKYSYQVSPFLATFPKQNIKFMWFEDFVLRKENFFREFYSFLGLDYYLLGAEVKVNVATKIGRSTQLYRELNKSSIFNFFKKLTPLSFRNKYRELLKIKFDATRKSSVSIEFKKKFYEYIEDDLNDFLKLTNAPESIKHYYLQSEKLSLPNKYLS